MHMVKGRHHQISTSVSPETHRKTTALRAIYGTISEVLAVAIDRLYRAAVTNGTTTPAIGLDRARIEAITTGTATGYALAASPDGTRHEIYYWRRPEPIPWPAGWLTVPIVPGSLASDFLGTCNLAAWTRIGDPLHDFDEYHLEPPAAFAWSD